MSEEQKEPTHQTVGWLIKQLQEYPKNIQVRFATGAGARMCFLSYYLSRDDKTLWIDIGNV